jgi:GntR family transcriptional regulator, galactonate operon transcriptional repressor
VEQLDGAVAHSARYVEVDLALHGAILEATHNELLARMTSTLEMALEAGRVVSSRIPGGTAGAMAMHRAVVDAIVGGDAPAAEAAMTRLVVSAARDVEHVMGGGDETA